jgi:peptidoglycan-associated lipoprotein
MPRLIALLLVSTALGCAHKQQTPTAGAAHPASVAAADPATSPSAAATAPTSCVQDLDCGPRQLCVSGRCADITPGLAECAEIHVQFEFNSALVSDQDRAGLVRSARCLGADQALHVTIAGNADERGTEEYNMALGDSRAAAVASYLRALGVSERQLDTVSYGKERPVCAEHDEACWAKNRRADLHLSAAAARRTR